MDKTELKAEYEKYKAMDKYERVHHWLVRELDNTIDNYPLDENIKSWLRMLRESYLYNLDKPI